MVEMTKTRAKKNWFERHRETGWEIALFLTAITLLIKALLLMKIV